jgi:hypothetical protein
MLGPAKVLYEVCAMMAPKHPEVTDCNSEIEEDGLCYDKRVIRTHATGDDITCIEAVSE